jgi:hypothetical protein
MIFTQTGSIFSSSGFALVFDDVYFLWAAGTVLLQVHKTYANKISLKLVFTWFSL